MDIRILNLPEPKLKQFKNKGINTIEDLLNFFPVRYHDFRELKTVLQLSNNEIAAMSLTITKVYWYGKALCASCKDDQGQYCNLTWFNADYMERRLTVGKHIYAAGKVKIEYKNGFRNVSITNPDKFTENLSEIQGIKPVYRKIPGMSQEYLEGCINQALQLYHPNEPLEISIIRSEGLLTRERTVNELHNPTDIKSLKMARKRLVFEDLLMFNVMLFEKSEKQNPSSPYKFAKGSLVAKYLKTLPFDMTEGQKIAVKTLLNKGRSGDRISSLLIGDVGFGKTEVAKCFALMGVEVGCQAVIMAPTVVLAQQHFHDFEESFKDIGVKVCFLSSDLKVKERKEMLQKIASGEFQVIVGTHSCVSDSVKYRNLGLIVVDEEHRFGVSQREKLTMVASQGVHSLSMSATPIPRSLALAMYGNDIDILELKTAPAFKKPIITSIKETDDEILEAILGQLKEGHQAYVVCPLIDESDSEKLKEVEDVTSVYKKYSEELSKFGFRAAMLNGKMKPSEVEETIQRFASGEVQTLISTTVIEVGVNVKNATLMVIKNAERFGLATLHQLRGRVGRGAAQGYCILQTNDTNAQDRIQVLVDSNDGFLIAQKDLETRGAGDFIGTAQTGGNKYFDEMMKYPKYNLHIRGLVEGIYGDPDRKEYYEEVFLGELKERDLL